MRSTHDHFQIRNPSLFRRAHQYRQLFGVGSRDQRGRDDPVLNFDHRTGEATVQSADAILAEAINKTKRPGSFPGLIFCAEDLMD
jgi:hypothetical protein